MARSYGRKRNGTPLESTKSHNMPPPPKGMGRLSDELLSRILRGATIEAKPYSAQQVVETCSPARLGLVSRGWQSNIMELGVGLWRESSMMR
jgi:hypothetical protein